LGSEWQNSFSDNSVIETCRRAFESAK
jgi:hypothetical protein